MSHFTFIFPGAEQLAAQPPPPASRQPPTVIRTGVRMTPATTTATAGSIETFRYLSVLYAHYAVASHYYKKLFCENSDVHGFL